MTIDLYKLSLVDYFKCRKYLGGRISESKEWYTSIGYYPRIQEVLYDRDGYIERIFL